MKKSIGLLFIIFFLVFSNVIVFSQEKPDALKSYRIGRDLEVQGRMSDANARYDEAVQICKQEIAQNATNMDSYTVLTWALLRQKKYNEVIEWAQKGLKVNPSDYRVIETMGEAYFYLNQYDFSLKNMQKYIEAAPNAERVSVAYFFMGEVYRIKQKYNHADIAYSTAVRLEPNMPVWWYRLGSVREALGDYAGSLSAYERAVKLNPSYKEALDGADRVKKRLG
ncbi:tetratricopeptide repeat protein [Gracilinema caldarium]|uniref:Tetratricopeptide TPR_1 repeat-containing protein n=1 Tax=Gracilinema caldarium (strain ATCC 51460 / DSM 7334 / H1) TaxID=744872 RepID=F8EWS0_GRAC1|nr:tetratricopeptide repeat protein [Gracilinema caldarium]AEJ18306.1 Tetratricopeptide TPR_1 repeat-containing protein [Gracilinema caldarium DSM 7334]